MAISTSLQNSLRHRTAVKTFHPLTDEEAEALKETLISEGFDVRIHHYNNGTKEKRRMCPVVRAYERKK